ncbi:hypothetical protein HAX54_015602 [Datura stramonium]|uniref:Uncharacterized protein n=1 Tax=Datura stramonium TaxID=4076 RepID=A0ABS8RG08_DATST|nr:hypothetical protein [Datura stramonium]
MTNSITTTILQSFTGMNNACRSPYYYSLSSLLYRSTSNFSLKEENLKCFGGQHCSSLSLLTSGKPLLNKRKFVVRSNGSLPSPPSSNPLNGWVIGILLSIALPFFRFKWGSLLQLKNKVEDVIETVEDVVDGVEKVAEEMDKVAEHIGNVLPESQLKHALKAVENFSEETAKVAHAAGDFIDQLQGDDVELVEEVVVDLPEDQLKDFSDKTAKVAHAAEDLKEKVKEVELKAEEISWQLYMAMSLIMIPACYMSTNLNNLCTIRSQTQIFNPLPISKNNNGGCSFPDNLPTRSAVLPKTKKIPRDLVVHATAETGDLLSGVIPFLPTGENSWVTWAVGLGVTVPLLTARLLTVTKQVSIAAETVEKVAEAVEKVADDVDKAAEDFAAKLPQGGKLRGIVESIEHLAEETEKDAQLVQDLMDKVNFDFFPSILIFAYLAIQ